MVNNNTNIWHTLVSIFAVASITLLLIVSVVLYRQYGTKGVRHLFVFERYSAFSKGMEARYLDSADIERAYVDDLILGPITHGLRPLFAKGTRANTVFVSDNIMYIDLNHALLRVTTNASTIQDGIALLKDNVRRNFPYIQDVCVSIDGQEALSYDY